MKIKVKFFARLREQVGQAEMELDVPINTTAEKLWRSLVPDGQVTGDVLVAINHEYVDRSVEIEEGDEVAFFPPVTGG